MAETRTAEALLERALADEREGRFTESLRHCLHLLTAQPANAEALALASRLSMIAGDAGNAIAYACEALRIAPAHEPSLHARDVSMQARSSIQRAEELYAEAAALEPTIEVHVAIPGSQTPFDTMPRVQALLDEALRCDPALARAHAAAGNLCVRRGEYLAAMNAYQRAAFIDLQAEYALALSEILFTLGDRSGAAVFRERALDRQTLFPGRVTENTKVSVLALMTPGAWPVNAPLDFAIDQSRVDIARLYLTEAALDMDELGKFDVVLNAIGEAEAAHPAIRRAADLMQALHHPELVEGRPSPSRPKFLNDPANSWKTSRTALARALRTVPQCVVPETVRVSRDELHAWRAFPAIARPVDSHGGRGLVKLKSTAEIRGFLEKRPESHFDVAVFFEYRSMDGYYRKYRIALVGRKPYPYHLAISPEWMVHYIGSPTAGTPWMQAEEERFLAEPHAVFPDWDNLFGALANAIGLDYFAIDCSTLPDGRTIVFEADIASLLHCREPAGSYKYRYVPVIFEALERLLAPAR